MDHTPSHTFAEIEDIANYLCRGTRYRPKIGIICGSGLTGLVDHLTNCDKFEFESIPNFPVTTLLGHPGRIVFGILGETPVMIVQGRFHHYEGYPLSLCVMPVRVMKVLGITNLIVTNSAGAVNCKYNVGDIMIIKDHLNFMGLAGNNPLRGPNESNFGMRSPIMTNAYDKEYINTAKCVAIEMSIKDKLRFGVYGCLGGPNYETIAEVRMLHILGVDAIGSSTVHEVIAGRHCGMTVFGLSLITKKRILSYDEEEESVSASEADKRICTEFVCRLINKYKQPY